MFQTFNWFVITAVVLVGFLFPVLALSADPIVENVTISQRIDGSKLVDITYDVFDQDGDTLAVVINFSGDAGETWDFPVLGLTGDVGQGIVPGVGKSLVWDAGLYPDGINLEQFRVRAVASDVGVMRDIHSPGNVAILDFSTIDWSDQANIEKFSRADLCMVMASHLWPGGTYGDVPVIEQLKSYNPDLKIVGYVSAKSSRLSEENNPPGTFWSDWFTNTKDYWAYTTVGDTAQDWPGVVVLNITDPACREAMVGTIVDYHTSALNKFDGVYWDYFNLRLWVPDFMDIDGDPDLDGDGIAHADDPDEMAAYQAGQESLVTMLREALGEDFMMIFNGQRAYRDSTFASMSDGVIMEIFPTLHFPDPDMKFALDPNYDFSLFRIHDWIRTANGGPYVVLINPDQNLFYDQNGVPQKMVLGDHFRVVAMMADAYSCWVSEESSTFGYSTGWTTNNISLGPALGPPTFDGNFIRRDFRWGKVELEMTSGSYPNPFDSRVWALGRIVEELAIPYRFP